MATKSLGTLTINMITNIGALIKGLNDAKSKIAKFQKDVGKMVAIGAGFFATAEVVTSLAKMGDAWINFEGRIKSGLGPMAATGDVLRALGATVGESGSNFNASADAFAALSRSTLGLGLSQGKLLQITDSLNKAMVIGGGNAQSAAAAMYQFNQAISSGKLSGQEFMSVSEQAPVVLDILASSLKKTRGELKAMADAQLLTTELIIPALLDGGAQINEMYDNMGLTVGRAAESLATSMSLFGGSQPVQQFTAETADSVQMLADFFLVLGKAMDSDLTVMNLLSAAVKIVTVALIDAAAAVSVLIMGFNGFLTLARLVADVLVSIAHFDMEGVKLAFSDFGDRMEKIADGALSLASSLVDVHGEAARLRDIDKERVETNKEVSETEKEAAAMRAKASVAAFEGLTKEAQQREKINAISTKYVAAYKAAAGDQKKQNELLETYKKLLDEIVETVPKATLKANDDAEGIIASLRKQIALNGDMSKAASLRYDIEEGGLRTIEDGTKRTIISMAQYVDMQERGREAAKQAAKDRKREAEEEMAAYAKASKALDRMMAQMDEKAKRARQDATEFDVSVNAEVNDKRQGAEDEKALEGLYGRKRELAEEEIAIRNETNAQILDLTLQQADESNRISEDEFKRRVEAFRNAEAEMLAIAQKSNADKVAADNDWSTGAEAAFAKYRESASNVAAQSESFFTAGIQGMEDALTQFVMTGKMSFGDLVKSMLQMLVKSGIQRMLAGLMGGGGGGAIGAVAGLLGKADGGPVYAGQTYITGERGPEVYRPSLSAPESMIVGKNGPEIFTAPFTGKIIPNHFAGVEIARQKAKSMNKVVYPAAFSGRRASGGNVMAGLKYMVGERGPEVLVPGGASASVSAVTPQNQVGSLDSRPRSFTQNFNIQTSDADSFMRSQRQIARLARRNGEL